ncbi:hypothetical protein ACFQX7_27915 [Luedemannella flava]
MPFDQFVQTANIIADVRRRAEPLLARLCAKPETVAVGVLGELP